VNLFLQRIAAAVPGAVDRELRDGPWRAKSFLAAAAVALLGLGLWFSDAVKGHPATEPGVAASDTASPGTSNVQSNWSKPVPGYVRVCVSYIGGFLLGWAFRRFIKLAVAGTALIIALLALGRFVGCDTTQTQEQVKRGGAWVQREAAQTRDYLKGRLPSAAAGATGIFFGFRRRGRATTPASPQTPPDKSPPAP
jgi:uncharacterized membrane protein (Fun14 family)